MHVGGGDRTQGAHVTPRTRCLLATIPADLEQRGDGQQDEASQRRRERFGQPRHRQGQVERQPRYERREQHDLHTKSGRASAHVVGHPLLEDKTIRRARNEHRASRGGKLLGHAQGQRVEAEDDPLIARLGASVAEGRRQAAHPGRMRARALTNGASPPCAVRARGETQSLGEGRSGSQAGERHLQQNDRLPSPLLAPARSDACARPSRGRPRRRGQRKRTK